MNSYVCYDCGSFFESDQDNDSEEVVCTECGSIDIDSQDDYMEFVGN